MAQGLEISGGTKAGKPIRLSGDDMIVLTRMADRGSSVRTIARHLSTPERYVSPTSVARWLRRAKAPVEHLQMQVASLRAEAVESWQTSLKTAAKLGKHQPARDLLTAAGVIESQAPVDRISIIVGDGSTVIGLIQTPQQPILHNHTQPSLLQPHQNETQHS